jgi:hypothetical protein
MRAIPNASLRSLLLICILSAAFACRASMQITGSPRCLSSLQSQVAVGPVSSPTRRAPAAFARTNSAIASGSDTTIFSLMILPFPSTTQIAVCFNDTSNPT